MVDWSDPATYARIRLPVDEATTLPGPTRGAAAEDAGRPGLQEFCAFETGHL